MEFLFKQQQEKFYFVCCFGFLRKMLVPRHDFSFCAQFKKVFCLLGGSSGEVKININLPVPVRKSKHLLINGDNVEDAVIIALRN